MCIKGAEPTRRMSVNDRPDIRPYYELIVNAETLQYKYFICNLCNGIFLGISYCGIYKIDGYVLELL